MSLFDVFPGSKSPEFVNAIVEIPKGRRSKFEVDKETGLIKLDRYLYSSSHYPGDYGFVPRTLAEDGDALDMLVMVNEPTFSGCLIETRVVGLFRMTDRGPTTIKSTASQIRTRCLMKFVTLRMCLRITCAKWSIFSVLTSNSKG